MFISPESRQSTYLTQNQAGVRGGKFIKSTTGGLSDPDVPSDIVSRTPPPDGKIAGADNPYAYKLDGVRDEFGNAWNASPVADGQAVTVKISLPLSKIRRISAYLTKPNWDALQVLTRVQFDLDNPVYARTFTHAPYFTGDEEIPAGLTPTDPLEFSFNLPQRPVGHHVLLLEFDDPASGDALYQVIDFRYTN
ncbi:lytic polysaccharide monooxygenase [Streptomyces sp. NBC_00536]|uniref:lytic polysaccharide monooxygenase n=1 Tax=Streptomyces sp. NBC_00536 TaxID=2975769 RepID=UPI002E7FC85A|nr:lytic polysaccharide monooxygenase [Streptomyces sp. NBC_00536]WUC81222.1 lytic polysaccharide monooxygenase [Streptomyces sp. NBC_00536]